MNTQKTRTILVVEDEKPLLEAIRMKFEKNEIDVVTARSVEQATGYIDDDMHIDAVWLDHYLLGKGTGLDFVVHLKASEQHKNIPIFVVSNSGTPDKQHTYMRLGVQKYYIKAEHRIDDLMNEIKAYLDDPESQLEV